MERSESDSRRVGMVLTEIPSAGSAYARCAKGGGTRILLGRCGVDGGKERRTRSDLPRTRLPSSPLGRGRSPGPLEHRKLSPDQVFL
jgi:hypothetical protein